MEQIKEVVMITNVNKNNNSVSFNSNVCDGAHISNFPGVAVGQIWEIVYEFEEIITTKQIG